MSLKCILQGQDSKNLATKEELKKYLPLTGGELTGNLTGKYIAGTWLQTTQATDLSKTSSRIAILDDSGWIYYRTPTEIRSDIKAVPTSRKVNNQALSSDITLTGSAINVSVTDGRTIRDAIHNLVKPNIFVNPICQVWNRYPDGWSGVPVNRYICDHWRILSSDGNKTNVFKPASPYGLINESGANCTFSQFIDRAAQYNGMTMTCSVLKKLVDNTYNFVTATKVASDWTDTTDIIAFFGTSAEWRWINPGETLIGAKLEMGAHQTFAMKNEDGSYYLNEIPDYDEQLAKCLDLEFGIEYRTPERYQSKPVYMQAVNFGSLPNNAYKDVAHNINNLHYIIFVGGDSNGDNLVDNPYIDYINIGSANIRIKTNTDRSATSARVVIKYTKTTD